MPPESFWTALLLPLLSAVTLAGGADPVVTQLDVSGETNRLTHLQVSPETGQVYVAGVNRIYQLTADLTRLEEVSTGPVEDSPRCPASGCPPDVDTAPTDNVNKLLLVDQESRTLLTCGSVHQGACVRYELTNISWPSQLIPHAIAANDANSSTFAFIGPEHYNPWGSTSVLYVATTYTLVGHYRNNVPAISTRNLQTLDLAERSFNKHSMLTIDVKYRDHFLVQYVYGFYEGDYAYFLTVQRRSHLPGQHEQGYTSRIVRTCVTDANYDSYVEMTLSCGDGGSSSLLQAAHLAEVGSDLAWDARIADREKVLVTAFSPSDGYSNQPQEQTSVCVFSIKEIERRFNENIHMCFNGSMQYRNMEYVSGPILNGHCPKAGTSGNILHFCSVGLKISALIPLTADPVITLDQELVTSVTVTSTGHHTVALLGTSQGYIQKVLLTSMETAVKYAEVPVDPGSRILPDTQMDLAGENVYVLSELKVTKLRVQTCEEYTNCTQCLEARDPYCGWCSLEKRCTVRSECRKAQFSSPRWLTADAGQQCIDMERIQPDMVAINQQTDVHLTIRALPPLPAGSKYQCVFGATPPVDAVATDSGLRCPTPELSLRPHMPLGADHVTVSLSVRSSETNKDFVTGQFVYFDCGQHAVCGDCVLSSWQCSWCLYDNKCVQNGTSCHKDVVGSSNRGVTTAGSAADLGCPAVVEPREPILIADGVAESIVLEVRNLPSLATSPARGGGDGGLSGYTCVITVEGRTTLVPARVDVQRFVVCDTNRYFYHANVSELTANATVLWNYNHHIGTVNITLYKCSLLATHQSMEDCSLCLTRHPRYRCQWCGARCRYSEQCRQTPVRECPRPQIDEVYPLSGPVEGGTLLTLEGRNLGLRRDEVEDRVFVGDVPCRLVDYQVSFRVTCRTAPVPAEAAYTVRLGNNAGFTEANVQFRYKNIEVKGVHPRMGPRSGGTLLTLTGSNLRIGSNVTVLLDDLPCHVTSRSPEVTCVTSPSPEPRAISVMKIMLDDAKRTLSTPFTYSPDPVILDVRPLKSFMSGGRLLTVHGRNLDSVREPSIIVFNDTDLRPINSTRCAVVSANLMECPTPSLAVSDWLGPPEELTLAGSRASRMYQLPRNQVLSLTQQELQIGFLMDNVQSVRNLKQFFPNVQSSIQYVEDPVYFSFANGVKLFNGDTLVIEGRGLNAASDERDTTVTVGRRACNVTSLTISQLVCVPPRQPPDPTDERGRETDTGLPLVAVRVGNLRFPLGHLQYQPADGFQLGTDVIAGIAAGAVLLVLASLLVLLIYRRKSSQVEREYKRIQIQMDTLENNIRSECKQAFAAMCTWDPRRSQDTLPAACPDLQSELNNMAANFDPHGVACVDQRDFLTKVLFPGISEHPILQRQKTSPTSPRSTLDVAMLQLEQLIRNQHFLVTVIDTLEKQRDFTVRDKVTTASLLTVILLTDMEYMTTILHQLLKRHIARIAHSKHPHLMLRRTETVMEKLLTNWISVCLYSYIRDHLAPPLYQLTRAIKHQISSGPVDAVTLEAHHSLSEDRLLTEQTQYNSVTLLVTAEETPYERIPCLEEYQTLPRHYEDLLHRATVQALDCDTVSQVKQKIIDQVFCSLPASQRPSHHCSSLVWHRAEGHQIQLMDDDLTSKVVDGWRQVNTLSHYGVQKIATVSLLQNVEPTHNKLTPSSSSAFSLPSPLSPGVGTNIYVKPGAEMKVFHLVRPPVSEKDSKQDTSARAVPEVFLTRLLSNKAMIQRFIEDMMASIFKVEDDKFPAVIKWLFDVFDEEAEEAGIAHPEVLHAWKANCLPLRMWANLIRRPDLIFDVEKPPAVESSLTVISQGLVEACSPLPHTISKDSPSHRLLFAKDIARWQLMVGECFSAVRALPAVSDQDLGVFLQQLSRNHLGQFDSIAALKEMYIYINKYGQPIVEALDDNPVCQQLYFSSRLSNIAASLEMPIC